MAATVPQLSDTMQTVLDQVPEQHARSCGFIQRKRRMTGPIFVKVLVFAWLANPQASLEELTRVAALLGITIKPQSLDERFTPHAAELLHTVLQAAIMTMITADPVSLEILKRFTEVVILDSSTVALPEELKTLWSGCGTSNPEAGNAAIKLTVALDLKTGRLRGPNLDRGRTNDKKAALAREVLPVGALRIADLGYFRLDDLRTMDRRGVYFLSRFLPHTVVYDAGGRKWSRLSQWLAEQGVRVDQTIGLGEKHRLPCRLLAARVPAEVAQQREQRVREEAAKDGRTLSAEVVALTHWTVFVTNVPARLLSVEEALELGRARWQIELLFKLWKSEGHVDESNSSKPYRVLCELYAKLIALMIQHWLILVSGWEHVDRSLVKMASTIRQFAWPLAKAVGQLARVREIVADLRQIFQRGCRVARRANRLATCHRLLALGREGSTGALGGLADARPTIRLSTE